jgi:hypothetical protein
LDQKKGRVGGSNKNWDREIMKMWGQLVQPCGKPQKMYIEDGIDSQDIQILGEIPRHAPPPQIWRAVLRLPEVGLTWLRFGCPG